MGRCSPEAVKPRWFDSSRGHSPCFLTLRKQGVFLSSGPSAAFRIVRWIGYPFGTRFAPPIATPVRECPEAPARRPAPPLTPALSGRERA